MRGGFHVGQFTVMLILGAMYGFGLWALGIDLGLLIGIVAGLLTFVPYLGPASGVIFGVLAALVQHGEWEHVARVLAAFGIGQVIERARKNVVSGTGVSVRVGLSGRRSTVKNNK